MKNVCLLSFLVFIWLKIKKVNLKEDNLMLKNNILQSSNAEDDDAILLEPYKIEKFLYKDFIFFKYDCKGNCNNVYFSIDKENLYGTKIGIYDNYSNMKGKKNCLYQFNTGINITKNQLSNFNFGEKKTVYIRIDSIFQKNSENYIYFFHEGAKEINVYTYIEKNICYKIQKGNHFSFNFGNLYNGYTYLHVQSSISENKIKYKVNNENEQNKNRINDYYNLANNSVLSVSLEDENNIDLDICFDFYESFYLNITRESTEYSQLILSPGEFWFYSGIDNIIGTGHFLLTFNYNEEPFSTQAKCSISENENDIKSNDSLKDQFECEIIKDKFNYENYHIFFKVNKTVEKHTIILMKLNITSTKKFTKQYFSIYKSYPTCDLNMSHLERNISLSKNPYFFQIKLSNEIYNSYSQILLLTNEDTTMYIMEGEFTKENYIKTKEEKIRYIQILNIKELKNSKIDILTLIFHTAIPHQKAFFYYKCYTDNVHFLVNKEDINKEIEYKIELNDCINEKFYYFGIYKPEINPNIAFIDYLYGIGETYHSSQIDSLSIEESFEKKKFNGSEFLLTNFSFYDGHIETFSIECYSPILAYLSLNPYLIDKNDTLKEGDKITFYLTKGKHIDFNINNKLSNQDKIYYEINLYGNEIDIILSTDNNEIITYNKIGIYRNEIKTTSKISFNNSGNDTYIKFKIGKQSDIYIGNLNKDSYKDIKDQKTLIINVTREEENKFKELNVSFYNKDNDIKDVCLFFGFGKYPYINIPTDNCVTFEKEKTKDFLISYPFEKINNNNKSSFMNDDFYLIFSFPNKIIIPNIEVIKKEKSIEIKNYTQKIIEDNKISTDNYIIKSSEYNKINNMGLFIYISIFSENDTYKLLNYTISYANKIIHQNETCSNSKIVGMYYNFQDNFLDFDLKVTSNASYNIYLTKFKIDYTYKFTFKTTDFTIIKTENNTFTFSPILGEETNYYYITGNDIKSVNDYSKLTFNNKIEYNKTEPGNEIQFSYDLSNTEELYINIYAKQEKNYETIIFYESYHYKNEKEYGKLVFVFLLIFFVIVLIIVVIFKKEKVDQSVIEEQIDSDIPLVQT